MKEKNHIDDLMKERLYNFSSQPGGSVWNKIEGNLTNKRKRVPYLFLKIAAGMILTAGISYLFMNGFDNQDPERKALMATRENTLPPGDKDKHKSEDEIESGRSTKKFEQHTVSDKKKRDEQKSEALEKHRQITYQPQSKALDKTPSAKSTAKTPLSSVNNLQNGSDEQLAEENTPIGSPWEKDDQLKVGDKNKSLDAEQKTDVVLEIKDGQNTYEQTEKFHQIVADSKFEIALKGHAGPNVSYRNINGGDATTVESYNQTESAINTYAGGLSVKVSSRGRFSLQAGVYYAKMGQNTTFASHETEIPIDKETVVYDGKDRLETPTSSIDNSYGEMPMEKVYQVQFSNSTGRIDVSSPSTEYTSLDKNEKEEDVLVSKEPTGDISATQYFEFVELPLILGYRLIDRKWSVEINGGLVTNVLVGNKLDMDGVSGQTTEVNKFNYSGIFGIGIDYPIINNFSLNVEPRFKYFINSFNSSGDIDVHPYSFGLLTGLVYSF